MTAVEMFTTYSNNLKNLPKSMKLIEDRADYQVFEDEIFKVFRSENCNYVFDKITGTMELFGRTREENPGRFPAPNILDMEVTTICSGVKNKVCPFCYKANTPNGTYMTFDTFKKIFDKLPKSITQIAFGADATLTSNPDLWKMMEYARENGVIPNVTAAELSDDVADNLRKHCGAVAISVYHDKDVAYDSIKKLTDRGMNQVNIHCMISEETYDRALMILEDRLSDERLSKLNAIVFLSLKKKGRGTGFHPLSQEKFNNIVKIAHENNIGIGFDSCSSYKALVAYDKIGIDVSKYIIPCEAAMQSSYINVNGEYFPCSFCEDEDIFKKGIDVVNCEDFIEDVWNAESTLEFANKLEDTCSGNCMGCRSCPVFEV